MKWTKMSDILPDDGYSGITLCKNGTNDHEFWTFNAASYCDGEWYELTYDRYTGVLRKTILAEEVYAYANLAIPDYDELV